MQTLDNTQPGEKWQFNAEVTDAFDNMLSRSIPQYDTMRAAVFDIARKYVRPKTDVVDLGCSRGEALAKFVDEFGSQNRFVGVEVSPPMLEAARERFKGFISCGVVDIREHDLRKGYPRVSASVTLAVLTLQFTPIEYRQRIISDIYRATIPGGALVVVEKVLGVNAEIDGLLVENYLKLKAEHGYSADQIQRKRLALEGVLVPVTAKWNEDLLRGAGFTDIDCFWRWMNFAGWIAIKPGGTR